MLGDNLSHFYQGGIAVSIKMFQNLNEISDISCYEFIIESLNLLMVKFVSQSLEFTTGLS